MSRRLHLSVGLAAAELEAKSGHFDHAGKYVPPTETTDQTEEPTTVSEKKPEPSSWTDFAGIAEPDTTGDTRIEDTEEVFADGADWLFDTPDRVPTIWGRGRDVLWAEGEALVIAAGQGVGKTTTAAQLVRASLGLRSTLWGLPVTECKRVLYLAMDRPSQARRNLRRFFAPEDRGRIAGRFIVKTGPPAADFAVDTSAFLAYCRAAGLEPGDRVVVDSLKDAAIGLSEDRVGAGYNRARQAVLAAGIEVVELHHMIKKSADGGPPRSLADVYGSNWITGGAGSVVFLHGEAGGLVVRFLHLKQPDDVVGPWELEHTAEGTVVVEAATDVVEMVRRLGAKGATATDIAVLLFEKDGRNELIRARRRLRAAVERGALVEVEGKPNGANPTAARWFLKGHEA